MRQCERGRRAEESRGGGDVRGRRESQRRGNTQSAQRVQEGEEGRGWAGGLTWGERARKKGTGVEVQGRLVLLQIVRRGCWMPWTTVGAEASGGGGGGSGSGTRHRLGSRGGWVGGKGGGGAEGRRDTRAALFGGERSRCSRTRHDAARTQQDEAGRSRIAAGGVSTAELGWVTRAGRAALAAGGGRRAAGCWLAGGARTNQGGLNHV